MHRAFVLITLGFGLAACAANDGDEAIFISKNVAGGMGCTFNASANELYIPHGTYSLFAPNDYRLHPQLVSKITSRDDNVQARTIQVRGARVDLALQDSSLSGVGGDGLTHFETRFSAPIAPNGGITDSSIELIPTALADAIIAAKGITAAAGMPSFEVEVIASVTVFGDLSGTEVTSQEFQYPVKVCNNCVTHILGECPLPTGTVVGESANPCSEYQDTVSTCCTLLGEVICPATVTPAP